MIRLALGSTIMVAALGLQLAMVVGVIGAQVVLSLAGYAALFAGMILVVTGVLACERRW